MGKSKEITVGFKYLLGMHVPLCEAPIDAVLELAFHDRTFWAGRKASGRISVNRPELFGGKSREGGVGGYIDVEAGGPSQPVNDYLAGQLGGLVPAFRGVASLVFRQFYIGNNPYPQPLRVKVSAVNTTFGGWLPNLAAIGGEVSFDRVAVHVALDVSGSMDATKMATMKAAMAEFIASLPDSELVAVRIQAWNDEPVSSIERFGIGAADRAALTSFVDGLSASGTTNFDAGVQSAAAFFADADVNFGQADAVDFVPAGAGSGSSGLATSNSVRRVVVFVTDGIPNAGSEITAAETLAAIPEVEVLGINIELPDTSATEVLDSDGVVPVVTSDNADELAGAIYAGFTSFVDLNGVHILRDVLVNPVHGGEGDASLIGASFEAAAAQAFSEGMGFSFRWRGRGDVDAFRQILERHLDAATYLDETTGKFEIKLIRPDYNVESLTTFGAGGVPVVEWFDPEEPDPRELPNQVTVTYTRRDIGEPGTVTVTNVAAVVASGRVINHPVTYEGVTRQELAVKLAERDLLAKAQPIVKGGFRAAYIPQGINLGSAIIVNEPRLGLSSLVARVTEIEEPDGIDNSVVVRFAQDVWSADLTLDPVVEVEDGELVDYSALPANVTFAEELPYFELVRFLGQSDVDAAIAADDGYGFWGASANQPNTRHSMGVVVRNDSGTWIDLGATTLMPSWRLSERLAKTPTVTTFSAPATGREAEVPVGAIIQVDDEMMRLDSISVAGGVATFTVGRAVLDSVPQSHSAGAYAFVWQDAYATDSVEYTAAEAVEVRVLPQTTRSTLAVGRATSEQITFNSRAASPYPVGQLQVEGAYEQATALSGDVDVTWAHRDRQMQTAAALDDHTAASIGPEAGVAYIGVTREVYLKSNIFLGSDVFAAGDFFHADARGAETDTVLSPAQTLSWTYSLTEPVGGWPADLMGVEIGVRTERDGLSNRQTPFVLVRPLLAPINVTAVNL